MVNLSKSTSTGRQWSSMPISNAASSEFNFDPDDLDQSAKSGSIVSIGGELPFNIQIPTRLLDILTSLSPGFQQLDFRQKKEWRTKLGRKIYPWTRPGFYKRLGDSLHLGYAGQPDGHGKQHHWRLFYDERLRERLEPMGTVSQPNGMGSGLIEWGGLYLRSEAELRIAKALDQEILFFANARGQVSLIDAPVSNDQSNGRVEAAFMIFYQGKCLILEVDGQHHLEGEQAARDYVRDRMLLRAGLPTVRFTGRDCLDRPGAVVAECLSILQARS